MTPDRWERVKQLFEQISELPQAQRRDGLAREAGDDPELVAEVRSLLEWHERAGPFAEAVPEALCADVFAPQRGARRSGERIGAYRIEELIGTGGMGDVYRAVRDDAEYHAEVAIKIMRGDLCNPLAEQRFRTERQILAALDHPNIARLLDGGTTPAGMPYVVMELVAGESIDAYCDARKLGTRERVKLFLQVCGAVAYAHQRLVVHRDLKPNNILVTADGSVKLLDFGIAKLLESNSPTLPHSEQTVTHLRPMTLEYASPEQVSGGAVTTVSDVYSLGVVLYWLLTGQGPYGPRGANEAQRVAEILGDTVPTRPSLVKGTGRSHHRHIDADLDNVLLMALRKEPHKRYGSVEQLAADLRNFLAGLPVVARRSTPGYRFGKFARRHKVEIGAGAAVLLALVGALFFTLREARVAQRHFDSVRTLANRLFDFHDEIAQLPNATHAREMLVSTSLQYLDALNKERGSDRSLQEELGVAYRRIGEIQGNPLTGHTGDLKAAIESYGKSIALLEPLYAADPTNRRLGAILAKTYAQEAASMLYARGAQAAAASAEKAFALAETNLAGVSDEFARAKLLSDALWLKGTIAGELGKDEEAARSVERMLSIIEAYARAHPEELRSYLALSSAYSHAAIVQDSRLSKEEVLVHGVELSRKSLEAAERLVALRPDEPGYQRSLAESRFNHADSLSSHRQYREAAEQLELAAPVLTARAADKADMRAQLAIAMSTSLLGWARLMTGQEEQAEQALVVAARDLADLADRHDNLQFRYQLGQTRIRLGIAHGVRADRPHLAPAAQLDYWRKARDELALGKADIERVRSAVPADGVGSLFDLGAQTLLKAESAIARLSGASKQGGR